MTMHAIALVAMINSVVGLVCKDGECDFAVANCTTQPQLCETTNWGPIVMNATCATEMCSNIGMRRVAPGDAQVNMLAASLCPTAAFFDIVAVRDDPCNKFVVSSTSEVLPYAPWYPGEPNNANSSPRDGCSRGELKEGCVGFAIGSDSPSAWQDRSCDSYNISYVNQKQWAAVQCVVCAKLKSTFTLPTNSSLRTTTTTTKTTVASRMVTMNPPLSTSKPTQQPTTTTTTTRTAPRTTTTTPTAPRTTTPTTNTTTTSPIVLTLPPVGMEDQLVNATTAGNVTNAVSTAYEVADSLPTTDTLPVVIAVACVAVLLFLLCVGVVVVIVKRRRRRAAEADSDLPVVLVGTSAYVDETRASVHERANAATPIYGAAEFVKAPTDRYLPIPRASEVFDIRKQSIQYTEFPAAQPYAVGEMTTFD